MVAVLEYDRKIPVGGPWTIYDYDKKGAYNYNVFSDNIQKSVEISNCGPTSFESGDMLSVNIDDHSMIRSCAHLTVYLDNGTYIISMEWSAPEQYLENCKKLLI